MLFRSVHIALGLRSQTTCKAADWQALLDLLLEAGVPVEVYDAAVDVLHHTALMPCQCQSCTALADAADKQISRPGTLRALGSTARAGSNALTLIRSRYDQTGRYRVTGRLRS